MDSPLSSPLKKPEPNPRFALPGWVTTRLGHAGAEEALFFAGAALVVLDQAVRSEPVFAGLWRSRLALRCAVPAVQLAGRREGEADIRDAVHLAMHGEPGPAGAVYLAFQRLGRERGAAGSALVSDIARLLDLRRGDGFEAIVDLMEDALQMQQAPPLVISSFMTRFMEMRPDAEVLGWWLADHLLARRLGWRQPLPLLMGERYGPAFRSMGGRGRVGPSDAGFPRAVALALALGAEEACRLYNDLSRRTERLLATVPRLRSKSAGRVIEALLSEDAVAAGAPGLGLSRWAAMRLFERLQSFEAVRELSGRTSFRIYGL